MVFIAGTMTFMGPSQYHIEGLEPATARKSNAVLMSAVRVSLGFKKGNTKSIKQQQNANRDKTSFL